MVKKFHIKLSRFNSISDRDTMTDRRTNGQTYRYSRHLSTANSALMHRRPISCGQELLRAVANPE